MSPLLTVLFNPILHLTKSVDYALNICIRLINLIRFHSSYLNVDIIYNILNRISNLKKKTIIVIAIFLYVETKQALIILISSILKSKKSNNIPTNVIMKRDTQLHV